MATHKPTIICFPGAFHPASCLEPFTSRLTAAGYPNEAYTLPSVDSPDVGVADDAAFFVSVMKPHVEAGKDVILIVHSYAGFPGTVSIEGLDKRGREARGEAGGVLGIVYLAAFVPLEDETVYSLLNQQWLWWMTVNVSKSTWPAGRPGQQLCTSRLFRAGILSHSDTGASPPARHPLPL